MSWFHRCQSAVAKWGSEPAKFLLKTVLPAAIPGSGIVVGVAEQVLNLAAQAGASEGDFTGIATDDELKTVGRILDQFDDRLAHLAEQLLEREHDSPDKLARLVWQEMKKDRELADALRDIAGMVSRFDRLEAQNRELLAKVGYGVDLQETMLGVARRQEVLILDFVQDQQTAKGQLRELADNVAKLNAAISDLVTRPADALPKLRQLEAAQPQSAAVLEAVAVGAAFTFDLDLTTSSLEQAVQLRPDDKPLAALCQQVTLKTRGIGGDSSRKPVKPISTDSADVGFRPGDTLDGWKLLQLLGKGGYGQVFLAEKAGKRRALKVMLRELISDPAFESKFKAEFLLLHGLGKQPHIVEFDDFGKDDATRNWYFTMEYIDGESLQTRLNRGPLPPAEAVKLFTLLAGPGGLATVHEKGIVHRDIKPANILLLADGTPKLVDFGVAVVAQREEKTKTGGYTAMFASPEQLRGFPAEPQSDVYSLVGSLWYALTKQEPELFDADTLPTEWAALRDLLEKSMQYRAKQRLPNAGAVHGLLKAVDPASLTPKPVVAEAKRPALVRHERVKMPDYPPGLAGASAEGISRLYEVNKSNEIATLNGHGDYVRVVAFSPDGRLLASGSDDKTARLWSIPDGELLATLTGHERGVHDVEFSADGRLLTTASYDDTVLLWSVPDGKLLASMVGDKPGTMVDRVAFSPSGWLLAVGGSDAAIKMWAVWHPDENPNWAPSNPRYSARPRLHLAHSRDGHSYPGEIAWLHVGVENIGQGELVQLWAEVKSETPALDGLTATFGRIDPGQRLDRCLAVVLPADTMPGEITAELVFHEANGCAPPAQQLTFTVHPLPRPDFPTAFHLEAEVPGQPPERRTTCHRKEIIDVAVTVTNQTGEDLPDLELVLSAVKVPPGVRVTGGRWQLGTLNDESTADGRVSFTVDANAQLGPAVFEVRVVSGDGRTFAIIPVETAIV